MKTNNAPMSNTDERKDAPTLDPKQLQSDDVVAASEIQDCDLEKLETELKDFFSSLPGKDDSMQSMIRRSLLEDAEDKALVVKHGQATKTVKSLLGSTAFTVKEGADISEIHIIALLTKAVTPLQQVYNRHRR